MTVDVEDYFQVSAFERHISKGDWNKYPVRVEHNTDRILEMFDSSHVRATFFVLGWIAERFPQLVRRIADAGHEIASHGHQHTRVTEQNATQFRQDVGTTKRLLEDVVGLPVSGYRAASFSINSTNLWAFDTLQEVGYSYSSSIYPIAHDLYGMPEAPRFPFRTKPDGIIEIPITTILMFKRNFPCGGGGYFRLLPYSFSRWAVGRVNKLDKQPAVFYFHPWEIDPQQPRINGISLKARFRHYLNLNSMETRLRRLLTDFRWDRMDKVYHLTY
ncbi:MAG: XrtA system polysaccharide deacetylase [Gammaproteobacteria bacterium]